MMGRGVALASLLAMPLSGSLAEPVDPTPPFIADLQNAIRNVLKQDPAAYFKNYQGVMVGDGGRNIWLDNFGDEGAGIPTRFEIITVNDSD